MPIKRGPPTPRSARRSCRLDARRKRSCLSTTVPPLPGNGRLSVSDRTCRTGSSDAITQDSHALRVLPSFTGTIGPDITFFGFPVSPLFIWVVLEEPPAGIASTRRRWFTERGRRGASNFACRRFAMPVRVWIGKLVGIAPRHRQSLALRLETLRAACPTDRRCESVDLVCASTRTNSRSGAVPPASEELVGSSQWRVMPHRRGRKPTRLPRSRPRSKRRVRSVVAPVCHARRRRALAVDRSDVAAQNGFRPRSAGLPDRLEVWFMHERHAPARRDAPDIARSNDLDIKLCSTMWRHRTARCQTRGGCRMNAPRKSVLPQRSISA